MENFLYRKYSIGIEIDKLFPGCVIYIRRPYEGQKWWVLRAYCSHVHCRQYVLKATYNSPKTFSIEYNKPKQIHHQVLSRQIRRFERNEMQNKMVHVFLTAQTQTDIENADSDNVRSGNAEGVGSVCVYEGIRRKL